MRRKEPSTEPSASDETCVRTSCCPAEPACRRIRRWTAPPIITVPRPTAVTSPAKRRRPRTPNVLAKAVSRRINKKPRVIVEELTQRYQLTPDQQRATTNHVIAMRAMQRRLSTDIRRQLPVRQTDASISSFLDTLAAKLTELSTSDSTEDFV